MRAPGAINYATLWERIAADVPDRCAVWDAGAATTYAELDARAGRLGAGLAAAGVRAGDRVALNLYNGAAYVEALLAAFKLGAVPVNVNYRYRERELARLLGDARPAALIFHSSLADSVRPLVAEEAPAAVVVEDEAGGAPTWAIPREELIDGHDPIPGRARSPEDRLLLYTGGTTGLPKGVVWRQGDLFRAQVGTTYREVAGREPPADLPEAVAIATEVAAAGDAPRFMPLVPLMHGAGLLNTIGTLTLAGTVIFPPGRALDPEAAWRVVEEQQVSRIAIAGEAIARPLVEELERARDAGRPYEISSLSRITSSGAAWSDATKRRLLEQGDMVLVEVIASSEGGPYAISRVAGVDHLPTRFRLAPTARVLDDDGRDIEPGSKRPGRLAFTGPMPLGYHEDPEATAAVFQELDGRRYVIPGDLARLAADGSVEFLGRGAAVVNSGGEKVFPQEIEQVLLAHPEVADCAVIGVPHERWGEAVVAIVEPVRTPVDPAELVDRVGESLADYKKPKHIVFTNRMPRGPNAKLELAALRSLAERQLATEEDAASACEPAK